MAREGEVSIDFEGAACDSEAARLLPWFVTGSLSGADTERVSRHLERCEVCRGDVEHERALRAMLKADGPIEYAPQAGLAKTLARIDELTRELSPQPGVVAHDHAYPPVRRRMTATRWLAAAVIVQSIGLALLGGSLLDRRAADRGRYETLSSVVPAANGDRIRAVFTRSMTIGELQTLLASHRLMIVTGPSDAGVFTLGAIGAMPDRGGLEALLASVRSDPHVLFAEPATGEEAQR